MIERFPPEVIGLIAANLSQSDCYHLLLTSKLLYNASVSRLYDSIIVDSTNQIFHKELINFNDVIEYQNRKYKSTVIKSCNGLKHFFKTLKQNESLIKLINYIRVIKLPDHFIEFELVKYFKFLFVKLTNLKGCDFQYHSCFINLNELITALPHHERLVELTGDFTTTMSLKKKQLNGLTNLANTPLLLQKLKLINFQSSLYLKELQLPTTLKILSVCKNQQTSFPINYSLVNSIGIDFNYLQDCFNKYFYNGMTNELQNDFNSIFNRNNSHLIRMNTDIDLNIIKNLFYGKRHSPLQLEELEFQGVTFNENDDRIMSKYCDLTKLVNLTILDCDETYNSYWLFNISPSLVNLKELNISHDNHEDIPNLLSQIKNLEKLYVYIQDSDWDCLSFFKSLNKHKRLQRLIIDSTFDNQLKSIPIKILEKKLTRFVNLKKLRITISIKNLSRFIYNVLPYLAELEFLEIVFEEFNIINANGSGSSSAYMVDDVIYDNDNEDYEFNMNELSPNLLTLNKIKIINEQILYMTPSLQYVKLFNVLLTKDNFIKERGLENWFNAKLL